MDGIDGGAGQVRPHVASQGLAKLLEQPLHAAQAQNAVRRGTKCIAEVSGLASQSATPLAASVVLIDPAPIGSVGDAAMALAFNRATVCQAYLQRRRVAAQIIEQAQARAIGSGRLKAQS